MLFCGVVVLLFGVICCFVVSLFSWSVLLLCCRFAVFVPCGCASVRVVECVFVVLLYC